MSFSYGTRLFRLLLLFAVLPSVVLALVGYYLIKETTAWDASPPADVTAGVTDYHDRRVFDLIDQFRLTYGDDLDAPPGFIDFAFAPAGEAFEIRRGDSLLSTELMQAIHEAAQLRPHGFVEHDGILFQYSGKPLPATALTYAGVRHDPEYTSIMTSYQAGRAAQSAGEQLRRKYVYFLGVIFVAAVLASIGLAYYFSSRISRAMSQPLIELSQAARSIARGNFNQLVSPSGSREIHALMTSFNDMAAQLEGTTARLTQAERVAAWQHVARRFAHELKNPLQPILISLYRIRRSLREDEVYDGVREPLEAASEELQHLTDLADRFSALAKLPAPSLERTDVPRLLDSVAKLYAESLAAYDFRLELPAGQLYAMLDPTYFREALHNLLKNAMEASSERGQIVLRLLPEIGFLRIQVVDRGEGMPAEVQQSARMPYFTTRQSGTGLGLAVVEKTVSDMNGRLQIESTPGQGTTITITFPRISGANGG